MASWERWEGSEVGRQERWESSEVARWEKRGVVRYQGGRFLVLFKGGEHRLSPRFKLFVSDVTHQNEGADMFKTKIEKKTLPLKCLTFLSMHQLF